MADINHFKLWNVEVLKKFCRDRGLIVAKKKKEELVALAFAAACQGLPVVKSKQDDSADAASDYTSLLKLDDGTLISDPLKITEGWIGEVEGVKYWPPCMVLNISDYLIDKNERPLCQRLQNEYKEGW
jgi:hypothetical protein